jgi:HK97 family phage portal protein
MGLTRRDLLKLAFSRDGAKALSVSLQPGGFVTELRGYSAVRRNASTANLIETQARNELVFACLNVKGNSAHDPRLIVEQARSKGGKTTYEEVADHPFRALFMRPNPRMTEVDLMRAAIVSWDVSNPRRFYAEKVYEGSLLKEIWPLNPALMRPKESRSGETIGYTWSDGQQKREYSLEELLIRSAPAWYSPPPLPAALGSVLSDTSQTDYVSSFFQNGGIPPGLLKYKRPLNQTQRDDIREKWRATYGNALGGSHDVGVLDSDTDYQKTGASLDELSSQIMRSVAESRICMVFGVPPLIVYAYVGLLRATYSNLKEAWAGFWDATMSPAFKEWRMFWTWSLLTEFEEERDVQAERVRLRYDMSQVAALQDDVDAIQGRARDNLKVGGISVNEFRAAAGYPSVAGGDDIPALAGSPPPPAPKVRPRTDKGRDASSVQLLQRRMERQITAYLKSEYQAAAQAVRSEA